MTIIDEKIKMKNYNMILTEKQQKYQHYYQVKLINMIIFQAKKYFHLIKVELDQAKFTYFLLGKAFEIQIFM